MTKIENGTTGSSSNNRTNVQEPDSSIQSVAAKGGSVVINTPDPTEKDRSPQWIELVLNCLNFLSFVVTFLLLGWQFTFVVNDLITKETEEVGYFFNAFLVLAFFLSFGIGVILYLSYKNKESLILTFFPTSWKHERIPTYLLFFTVAVIIAACILKAKYKNSPIVESGVADGIIGVVASCCAAVVLQLLETWQRIRDRLRERNELLDFLGVDYNYFSSADRSKYLTIAIPTYTPPSDANGVCQADVTTSETGKYGTRGYSGEYFKKLCTQEDVQAYQHLQELLRTYDIPSKLISSEQITTNGKMFNDDDSEHSPRVQGNYICIGILTNHLAMACFHHDRLKKRPGVHHLVKINGEYVFKDGSSVSANGASVGIIYRWVQCNGTSINSIFILGGIGAEDTERTGEYFANNWKDILKKFKNKDMDIPNQNKDSRNQNKDSRNHWSTLRELDD